MKKISTSLFLILSFFATVSAQNVTFTYDAAGNRVKRVGTSGCYVNPSNGFDVYNSYNISSTVGPSYVMELGGGNSTDGNITVLWPYWGGSNQAYIVTPVGCQAGARMSAEEIFSPPFEEPQVSFYPNPVTDWLDLEVTGSGTMKNFQMYSASGTMVLETTSLSSNGVNMKTLPTGTYLVKVTLSNGSVTTYKVVNQ